MAMVFNGRIKVYPELGHTDICRTDEVQKMIPELHRIEKDTEGRSFVKGIQMSKIKRSRKI